MSELVGIPDMRILAHGKVTFDSVKRHLLMFDRLGFKNLDEYLRDMEQQNFTTASTLSDAEYLLENRLIFEYEDLGLDKYVVQLPVSDLRDLVDFRLRLLESIPTPEPIDHLRIVFTNLGKLNHEQLLTGYNLLAELTGAAVFELFSGEVGAVELKAGQFLQSINSFIVRMSAHNVSQELNVEALPIYEGDVGSTGWAEASKSNVLHITLTALPVPSENTSWQQILNFKSDPDSKSKLLALRHWMHEVARTELKPREIELKLEYLLNEYQQHLRLHKMETRTSTLETVLTIVPEVLGDLLSFRWGAAAKSLFELRKRNIKLLQSELSFPNREVAYIAHAKEVFGT